MKAIDSKSIERFILLRGFESHPLRQEFPTCASRFMKVGDFSRRSKGQSNVSPFERGESSFSRLVHRSGVSEQRGEIFLCSGLQLAEIRIRKKIEERFGSGLTGAPGERVGG